MKRKVLVLCIPIFLIIISIILTYRNEYNIRAELKNNWNISMDKTDHLKVFKKNSMSWHGEQQRFTMFELRDLENISNYIKDENLYKGQMGYDYRNRIEEIEEILNIKDKDRIDFDSNYHYSLRVKTKNTNTNIKKKDILYIILRNEKDKSKMFFIEDLNFVDLEGKF